MTTAEKFEEFREGLERLSRRTGVVIGGCGCCGWSPALFEISAEENSLEKGYVYKNGILGERISWEQKQPVD